MGKSKRSITSEAAVALGRLGGQAAAKVGGQSAGGKARAEAMTPERRRESARKAIEARWAKLPPERRAELAAKKAKKAAGKKRKKTA